MKLSFCIVGKCSHELIGNERSDFPLNFYYSTIEQRYFVDKADLVSQSCSSYRSPFGQLETSFEPTNPIF